MQYKRLGLTKKTVNTCDLEGLRTMSASSLFVVVLSVHSRSETLELSTTFFQCSSVGYSSSPMLSARLAASQTSEKASSCWSVVSWSTNNFSPLSGSSSRPGYTGLCHVTEVMDVDRESPFITFNNALRTVHCSNMIVHSLSLTPSLCRVVNALSLIRRRR